MTPEGRVIDPPTLVGMDVTHGQQLKDGVGV